MQGTVIIVNYNGGDKVLNCIAAVKRNFSGTYEIVVVDNASVDDSCAEIERLFPYVKVYRTGKNPGFGAACNFGARVASSDFLLFLNPDAYVENDCLSLMRKELENVAGVAFVGGVLKDIDGRVCSSAGPFPTLISCFYDSLGVKYGRPLRTDFASGALLLVKRSVFDQLQGFDEEFFMYFEETDLQYRAAKLGYSLCIANEASATHEVGGMCSDPMSRLRRYLHGMRVYFKKRHGVIGFVAASVISGLYLVSRWFLYRYRRVRSE